MWRVGVLVLGWVVVVEVVVRAVSRLRGWGFCWLEVGGGCWSGLVGDLDWIVLRSVSMSVVKTTGLVSGGVSLRLLEAGEEALVVCNGKSVGESASALIQGSLSTLLMLLLLLLM